MRPGRVLLVLAALLAAGCREATRDGESSRHPDGHGGDKRAAVEEGMTANVLRLDRDMLHDLRITTAAAEARLSAEGVTALGQVQVNEDAYAEVGAPVAARVIEVLAGVGDTVRVGQALIELSSVELGKARAEHLHARARAHLAEQVLQRKRRLAAERIVPQRELQEAEADAAAARAELEAAETSLEALGVARDDARAAGVGSAEFALRAPIAGAVIDRRAVRGQMADPASPLMRIADLSRLWLVAHASERDAVRMRAGAAVRASFPALPGRTFAGTVRLVGQQVDATSRTIPVRIEVANDEGLLRPGMSATAWVPLGDAGGPIIAVPAASLQRCDDEWCVFLPRGEGAFEMRRVGRGRDLGGEVEVVSGLQAGETVAVEGAFMLKAEADRTSHGAGQHDH